MKKTFLSLAAALMLLTSAHAQTGVDVTSKYLTNAGFDEDISMTTAGSAAKGTEDGSAWTANSAGSYDGFIAQVSGWTALSKSTAPKWLYMGILPYDYESTSKWKTPLRPTEVNYTDNKGTLLLKAGWGGTVGYRQKVMLPAGHYRLTYYVINTVASTTASKATNNFSIQCGKDKFADADVFKNTEWTKREFNLTSLDSVGADSLTITLGFRSVSSAGSGGNPSLFVDDIRLYKLDNVTRQEELVDAINALLRGCNSLLATLPYDGLLEELQTAVDAASDNLSSEDTTVLNTTYENLNTTYLAVSGAVSNMTTINALLAQIEKLLNNTAYPGADKLDGVKAAAQEKQYSGKSADIEALITTLNDAIKAYNLSQTATVDAPADYTFLVQHPWFVNTSAEPTKNSDGTYTFPTASTFANGKACADANSTEWYIGESGGDQRTNTAQLRPCWNAWNLNFNTVSINQNLSDIPDGYYKLSGDLDIAAGCATTQHIYATSAAGTITSNPDWSLITNTDYEGQWYTVNTTDKVLVTGGKLTIGATSTGDKEHTPSEFGGTNTDKRRGWFCATNFKLYYLGKASLEDITAAYTNKVAAAKAMADTMKMAGDKAALNAVINAYSNATDETAIAFALDTLQTAMGQALKSVNKYTSIMAAGMTIPTVSDSLLTDTAYNSANKLVSFALAQVKNYLASDTATYTMADTYIAQLKSYVNTYAPVFNTASGLVAGSSEAVAAYLNKMMTSQNEVLTANGLQTDSVVSALTQQLSAAILVAQHQNIYDADKTATDFTGFIQNPKAEAETGWVLNKGYGDKNIGSGQYYDTADPKHRYFDSYNSTAGKLNFNGYQRVVGVPNGTYTVGADVRTSGNGAYIFAAVDTFTVDTTWMEIPLQTYTYLDDATGKDTTVVAADKYGKIWQDATDANITSANAGNGYGWEHIDIANIVVRNHVVVIGMSTDPQTTHKAFDGKWFSATNWTLTQTAAGDNTDWDGPLTTGVKAVTAQGAASAIYTINGVKVSSMNRTGLYIVIKNGAARKVLIK